MSLPRFVGRWATANDACETTPWLFEAQSLKAPELDCAFTDVQAVEGGYDITARCVAPHDTPLRLRFAEDAQALLVDGDDWPPTSLIFCGRP